MRSHFAFFLTVFLAACGGLEHDSPFDPLTPSDLQAKAGISGQVLLEGESDHSQVDIELKNATHTYLLSSDAGGRFSHSGVVPGRYAVRIGARYFGEQRFTIEVEIGTQADLGALELRLRRTAVLGSAILEAQDANDLVTRRGGATVRLMRLSSIRSAQLAPIWIMAANSAPPVTYTTLSAGDGSYTFDDVPAGIYTLEASGDQAGSATVDKVTVTGDGDVTVEALVLQPLTGFFTFVDGNGDPLGGFTTADSVTLHLSGFGASEMAIGFSPTGAPEDCGLQPNVAYAGVHELDLGSEGRKTVCVQFFNAAGNQTPMFTKSVVYDQSAPHNASVSINNGAAFVGETDGGVILSAQAIDDAAGVVSMKLSNLTGADCAVVLAPVVAEPYATLKPWALGDAGAGKEGSRTVCAAFGDAAGNWSDAVSAATTYDTLAPQVAGSGIVMMNGATNTTTAQVTLALLATGANEMMLANGTNFGGAIWEPFHGVTDWYLTSAQGQQTVSVRFRDPSGNIAGPYTAIIDVDTVAPSSPSISINSGAPYATTTAVSLTLSAQGATLMQVSNDGVFDLEPVAVYNGTLAWQLTPGDAIKAVFVRFLDAAGNVSPVASAFVQLDTAPPSDGTIAINSGAVYTRLPLVSLQLSSAGAHQMALQSGTCPSAGATWGDFAGATGFAIPASPGTHRVYARFRDPAGNLSTCISTDITLDDNYADSPLASLLGIEALAGRTRNALVTVRLSGLGADSYEMQVANDAGFAAAAWVPATTDTTWQLPFGDGLKLVYVRVRDRAGNGSNTLSPSITLDTTGPEAPGFSVADIDSDGFALSATSVELLWSASAGAVTYQVDRQVLGINAGFARIATLPGNSTSYRDAITPATVGRVHAYRVRALDDLSNTSGWSVIASTTPYEPITKLYWTRGAGGYRYNFPAGAGTFMVLPSYIFSDYGDSEVQETLSTNVTKWTRANAAEARYTERLLVKTTNQDNTLVYQSAFDLGLGFQENIQVTPAIDWYWHDLKIDPAGRMHIVYRDNTNHLHYANNVTGTWASEPLEPARIVYEARLTLVSGVPQVLFKDDGGNIRCMAKSGSNWPASAFVYTTPGYGRLGGFVADAAGVLYATSSEYSQSRIMIHTYATGSWSSVLLHAVAGDEGFESTMALNPATGKPVALAGMVNTPTSEGFYYYSTLAGSWSTEPYISVTYPSVNAMQRLSLAVDLNGVPHFATGGLEYDIVDYTTKVGGIWTRTVLTQSGSYPSLVVSGDNTVFIGYLGQDLAVHSLSNATGAWHDRVLSPPSGNASAIAAWEGPDGLEHVASYYNSTSIIRHTALVPEHRSRTTYPGSAKAVEESDGTLWSLYATSLYVRRLVTNKSGAWTDTLIDSAAWDMELAVESGKPYMLIDGSGGNIRIATTARGPLESAFVEARGIMGGYNHIAVAGGRIHAVYQRALGGGSYGLRYAYAASVTAALTGGWTFIDIQGAMNTNGLVAEASGAAHLVSKVGAQLTYGTNKTGTWDYELIDNDAYESGGGSPRIALGADGAIHAVYSGGAAVDTRYAVRRGGAWSVETVDAAGYTAGESNIVVAADGSAHLVYTEGESSSNIRYATNRSGQWVVVPLWEDRYANGPRIFAVADDRIDVTFEENYADAYLLKNISGVITAASVERE